MKKVLPISLLLLISVWYLSCFRAAKVASDVVVTDGSDHINLDVIAEAVLENQDKGEDMSEIPVRDNQVEMPDGSVYQLIELSKNECPDDIEDCDVIDSEDLGIGDSALVDELDLLRGSIRSQGSRGTCVAFSINAGVESWERQGGAEIDLSEQYTYLIGHQIAVELSGDESDWDASGLWPDDTINGLVDQAIPLVSEEIWPYNRDEDCEDYLATYPDATCSESEVQGGGEDNHEPDPNVEGAEGYVILEAEELYASIGHIKKALYAGYPVVVTVKVNSDFNIATYKAGTISWIFKSAPCGTYGCGHAVLAVGYQDHPDIHGGGFLVLKNSWGDDWAAGGLGYATYEWLENSLRDAIAIKSVQAPQTSR